MRLIVLCRQTRCPKILLRRTPGLCDRASTDLQASTRPIPVSNQLAYGRLSFRLLGTRTIDGGSPEGRLAACKGSGDSRYFMEREFPAGTSWRSPVSRPCRAAAETEDVQASSSLW